MLVVRAVGPGLDHAQFEHVAFDYGLVFPYIKCISPSVATVVVSFDVLPDTTFPLNFLGLFQGCGGILRHTDPAGGRKAAGVK